ncbi:acyltransferase family protein [Amycolatopsis suaedae]|uniref:Acyltransferase n=1 Tax=Amycolatopsis suaedae TaxID=2510978 RepID=A0A4Q7IYP2_9PSEU|nr:acyltransferase family protein [Amycolatopsis suaedae]RZQ60121.1 acyltransferase [Amycolatopsis suaedae]
MNELRVPTRRYRPELQGLRAVAALLVVVYHVWLNRVSGGVDVFFLISGFLLTGQLVRAAAGAGIRWGAMWGRMVRRLFPAALTVLLGVVVASFLLLPENRWFSTIREVAASALYLENWQLVADSADYFAQHGTASPVQHYWSLSIQGQFYLLWPLLVGGLLLLTRSRRTLTAVLLAVFAASLLYSVTLTATDQPVAYFDTATRMWEFALGGLLALAVDRITLPRAVRVALGWLGVAGLVSCGLVLQVGTVFPGYAALWPLLSGAAVIAAGSTGSRAGADRWLSARPVRHLGDLSYALYLWHWPVLVLFLVATGRDEPGLAGGAAVIGLSLLLAAATHHLVERPAQARQWGAVTLAAATLLPVLAVTGGWQAVATGKARTYAATVDNPDHPGARAKEPGFTYWGSADPDLAPSLVTLPQDYATIPEEQCGIAPRHPELTVCTTGELDTPQRRIVVAGDSHAQQFVAALQPAAQRRNWQIITMVRGGCPFSTDSETVPGDQPCMDWNAAVADEIVELRPDLVFTIATRDVRVDATEYTPPGYVNQWRKVDAAGIPVLAVRDNPRFGSPPVACVESRGPASPECATPRAQLYAPDPPYTAVADLPPGVAFADFSDYFCEADVCPPVIGNVLVYLDDNHVSATYMATMSEAVEQAVVRVLEPEVTG